MSWIRLLSLDKGNKIIVFFKIFSLPVVGTQSLSRFFQDISVSVCP